MKHRKQVFSFFAAAPFNPYLWRHIMYKKFNLIVVSMLICVLGITLSYAKEQNFTAFSVDVPQGWVAEERDNGATLIVKTKRKTDHSVTFKLLPVEQGKSMKDRVEEFAKKYKGKVMGDPLVMKATGVSYKENNMENIATFYNFGSGADLYVFIDTKHVEMVSINIMQSVSVLKKIIR
jgi:hypothetical protein